jgi:hypothetical protein
MGVVFLFGWVLFVGSAIFAIHAYFFFGGENIEFSI